MKNNKIILTNIQRFSLHDGPGIRTTVFLKGCSLHCPWCSNPENISPYKQEYIKDGKKGIYGQEMDVEEVFNIIAKDKIFYGDEGGVTFSGGEPLLQIDRLIPLFARLKQADINIAIETCLFVDKMQLTKALEWIDLFYIDVKILNEEKCSSILGGDLNKYLSNLSIISNTEKHCIYRIPFVGGYTDDIENKEKIVELLKHHSVSMVEIIKGHNLGLEKRRSLGVGNYNYIKVSDDAIEKFRKSIEENDIEVVVCKI